MEKNKFINAFAGYVNKESPSPQGFFISNKKSDDEIAHAISMRVGIAYKISDTEIEDKIIIIRRVLNRGNDLILDALDEEMKEPRMFFVSKIKKIQDIASGETYANVKDFILTHAVVDGMKRTSNISDNFNRVINRVRNEVTALIFLASVDGHYLDKQKNIIIEYIKSRTKDIPCNEFELLQYIDKLYPDADSFYDAIDDLAVENPAIIQNFIEVFIKLIFADGFVSEKEKLALAELIQTFKEDGLDLKIAV